MKSSIFWALMAFLLGTSVFGIYKSWDLSKQNAALTSSLDEVKNKLSLTEFSLKETTAHLNDSLVENKKLEGAVSVLRTKLAEKEKEAQGQIEQIALLTQKIKETSQVSVSLLEKYNSLTTQVMRLELENVEMKKTLSSVHELKRAIKELKTEKRGEPRQAREARPIQKPAKKNAAKPAEKKRLFGRPLKEEIIPPALRGNEGFFVKDGKSTFEGLVEIQVVPAELEPVAF